MTPVAAKTIAVVGAIHGKCSFKIRNDMLFPQTEAVS
jgi:hypothetical protein